MYTGKTIDGFCFKSMRLQILIALQSFLKMYYTHVSLSLSLERSINWFRMYLQWITILEFNFFHFITLRSISIFARYAFKGKLNFLRDFNIEHNRTRQIIPEPFCQDLFKIKLTQPIGRHSLLNFCNLYILSGAI